MQLQDKNFSTETLIHPLSLAMNQNRFYIKRDDLLPFSFGGNKARVALNFFEDLLARGCDTVVTYGSSGSNHCRVVANLAAKNGLNCYIVTPQERYEETYNSWFLKLFGAQIVKAPLDFIAQMIDALLAKLSKTCKPYFIPGGGHGNLGTQAYVDAYDEICAYESNHNIRFDYIFHASGTGTTQAGLVCGAVLHHDDPKKIVGISIARENPRGQQAVEECVRTYLKEVKKTEAEPEIVFDDNYLFDGYACSDPAIEACVFDTLKQEGIALDPIYTGKAYYGMQRYIEKNQIIGKNILFIHTGGSPLLFDDIGAIK